jgi:hypothetical protein
MRSFGADSEQKCPIEQSLVKSVCLLYNCLAAQTLLSIPAVGKRFLYAGKERVRNFGASLVGAPSAKCQQNVKSPNWNYACMPVRNESREFAVRNEFAV